MSLSTLNSTTTLLSTIFLNRIRRRRRHEAQERRRRYFEHFRRRQRETTSLMVLLLSMFDTDDTERIPRSVSSLPYSMHWWNNIVLASWDDQMWLENFRMTKETFRYLVEELKPHISKKDTNWRRAIPADQRLAIALWKLSTNIGYKTVAELFGVGTSTVHLIVVTVVSAINNVLKNYISIPTGKRLQECMECFEHKGFPQAVAAVDCCHMPILAPPSKREYINRKGFSSIILQAVIDSFGQFIDLDIGCPGSMDEAEVFRKSKISTKVKNNTIFCVPPKVIETTSIPALMLGAEPYPLMPNLMKPYNTELTLTAAQRVFNQRLSSCHGIVQQAFKHLKGRWCILDNMMDKFEKAPSLVLACCILHNIVESKREPFLDEWTKEDVFSVPHRPVQDDAICGTNATSIRNALTLHFIDKGTTE
nr:uncharacterized protein LOC129254863 [Lytechinus pictus]